MEKIGKVATVNMNTGEVVEEREGAFQMLPPAPGTCQECAVAHDPAQPHNQQSLYYQYAFFARNRRWPTWTDAIAHCTDDVKEKWRLNLIKVMKENNIDVPPDLLLGYEGAKND